MSFKFNLKRKANNRFAVRMRSYSKEEREAAGRSDASYIEKTLPESEWARYGFELTMSYKEASEHLKSLNAQSRQRDIQEKKARFKLIERQETEFLLQSAFLPEAVVRDFEDKLRNDSFSLDFEKSKFYFHWKTAMKVIAKLKFAPEKWAENQKVIIKEFGGYARSTISKLINLMNKYGTFYCRKFGKTFERLSLPRGREVGWISEQYSKETGGRTKEAKGIDLAAMAKLKLSEILSEEEKNWCIVCLGFALRPSEVDMISFKKDSQFKIKGDRVIIYQPKLASLDVKDRYKEVLITHPFQKEAVKIMKSESELKKPSISRLRKVLGQDYGLYSFRKGYFDIMHTLGEDIVRISFDLGHSSIDRTWRDYRKKIQKAI